MNRLFCLFTSHTRRKNYILPETRKWFIIVKFDYYKPFAYFVEDAYVI
jgi:hypothetical protein